jgi:hypothetical protein
MTVKQKQQIQYLVFWPQWAEGGSRSGKKFPGSFLQQAERNRNWAG